MLSPYNAAPFKWFQPFAKSPATCLTQDLPPSMDANCLLLGAGDPTPVLYTLWRERFGCTLLQSKHVSDFSRFLSCTGHDLL
jgi:hypothetical protein